MNIDHEDTYGLLGGKGHLGQATVKRARECGLSVLSSTGKNHNHAIARASNVLINALRPADTNAVLRNVRGDLNADALIVSFAAALRRADYEAGSVVRAMTDIDFSSVRMIGEDSRAIRLLSQLSRAPLMFVSDESDLDRYTVGVGCLPGVSALKLMDGSQSAREWLNGWTTYIQRELKVPESVIESIIARTRAQENLRAYLEKIRTQGGITDALVTRLTEEPDVSPIDLMETGMRRTEEIIGRLKRTSA